MRSNAVRHEQGSIAVGDYVDLLRCPISGGRLAVSKDGLSLLSDEHRFRIEDGGIPIFADKYLSAEAEKQRSHYDRIAKAYEANLSYPHTIEYMRYLDDALAVAVGPGHLGTVAEICCGHGEAFNLYAARMSRGVGVDISIEMLKRSRRARDHANVLYVQGDATGLPLASSMFDHVFMLGGIHHVNDRLKLFSEVHRVLKPGGIFIYREPVSDFILWRALRAVVYRVSPVLDHATERPLLYRETVPVLEKAALRSVSWSTHGFIGFCIFMNSDVLFFNRLFKYVPGIRALTLAAAKIDKLTLRIPGLERAGLQVVGKAMKEAGR